jgi:hypothetical protein
MSFDLMADPGDHVEVIARLPAYTTNTEYQW